MADIDDKIRNGLRSLENDYDDREESLLRDVLFSHFRGRLRSASIVAWCAMLLYGAAAVYCAFRVLRTEAVQEMVLFGAFLVIAVTAVMVTKLWYWMLANRNAVQREVKRLESRVADLADRLATE